MTAQASMSDSEARQLRVLERAQKEEKAAKHAVWAFLWTLFVFKIVTIGLILYAAGNSAESQAIMYATSWLWLIIPAAAIASPFLYWRRKRKQRKQRDRLIQSEWMIDERPPESDGVRLITLGDVFPGPEPPAAG
jgi:hypothetical protein